MKLRVCVSNAAELNVELTHDQGMKKPVVRLRSAAGMRSANTT
ncbi:hypothetical protein SEA_BUTTON_56 [Gordonia phage Button]|nr:hypothetical protein SEA_BUTTON_56 [Gordonia phage Button]